MEFPQVRNFAPGYFGPVSLRGGFGGGMHTVLRHFVDATWRRLLMEAEQLIQRTRAFSGGVGFFDCFRYIRFCENQRVAQLLPGSQLRGNRG